MVERKTLSDQKWQGTKEIPEPPSVRGFLRNFMGPGIAVQALAVGAGELIVGCVVGAAYGPGIAWLLLIAVAISSIRLYWVGKYTIVTGETIVKGVSRVHPALTLYCLLMPVLMIPAFYTGTVLAIGTIVGQLFHVTDAATIKMLGYVIQLLCVLVIFVPRTMAWVMERITVVTTFSILVGMLSCVLLVASPTVWADIAVGLLNFGYIPEGMPPALVVTTFGAVGTPLIGCMIYSEWIKEKGYGMAKYMGKLKGVLAKEEYLTSKGYQPKTGTEEVRKAKGWSELLAFEIGIGYSLLTIFTVLLFFANASGILYPLGIMPSRETVVSDSAYAWGVLFGGAGVIAFLSLAFLLLWDSLLSGSTGYTEISGELMYSSLEGLPFMRRKITFPYRKWWYIFILLWYVVITIFYAIPGIEEAMWYYLLAGIIGSFIEPIIGFVVLYVPFLYLPKEHRPSMITAILYIVSSCFILVYAFATIYETLASIL